MTKLSAKHNLPLGSEKVLGGNKSSPSCPHDHYSTVFANLPFYSSMAMRLDSCENHCPKAFLKVSGMCHSGRWSMGLGLLGERRTLQL